MSFDVNNSETVQDSPVLYSYNGKLRVSRSTDILTKSVSAVAEVLVGI